LCGAGDARCHGQIFLWAEIFIINATIQSLLHLVNHFVGSSVLD
jgi:hypothetical protein